MSFDALRAMALVAVLAVSGVVFASRAFGAGITALLAVFGGYLVIDELGEQGAF